MPEMGESFSKKKNRERGADMPRAKKRTEISAKTKRRRYPSWVGQTYDEKGKLATRAAENVQSKSRQMVKSYSFGDSRHR